MTDRGAARYPHIADANDLRATDWTKFWPPPIDWGAAQQTYTGGGGGGPLVPTEGQIWPRAYPT